MLSINTSAFQENHDLKNHEMSDVMLDPRIWWARCLFKGLADPVLPKNSECAGRIELGLHFHFILGWHNPGSCQYVHNMYVLLGSRRSRYHTSHSSWTKCYIRKSPTLWITVKHGKKTSRATFASNHRKNLPRNTPSPHPPQNQIWWRGLSDRANQISARTAKKTPNIIS